MLKHSKTDDISINYSVAAVSQFKNIWSIISW